MEGLADLRPATTTKVAMERLFFASDNLPAELDERARFSVWRDLFSKMYGSREMSCLSDRPFRLRMEGARLDGVDILQMRGTINRANWTTRCSRRQPDFFLCLNRTQMTLSQLHRDAELPAGAATVGSFTEFGEARWREYNDVSLIVIPQARLQERVPNVEDVVAKPVHHSVALHHLRRYLEIVRAADDIEADSSLGMHIARTLVDLVVLVLGAEGDAAELARSRGLRAARLQQIIAEIRANFADPAFSTHALAGKLGVTPRYVQRLLHESRATFQERVMELRLQRARVMLADPRYDILKVADVASACGFNEIPYFNRCFRRRFGDTPTQYRAGASAG